MKPKTNKKLFSVIITFLVLITNITPSFAHNAVFFNYLVGPDFTYQVQVQDDVQGSTEASHYEFSYGYFLDAGSGKNRPLFKWDLNEKTQEETSNSSVKVERRGPGYIYDESANKDRVSYYQHYSKYKNHEGSTIGLSLLGKRFTFPPMNAMQKGTNKVLHMDTTSEQIKEISFKSERMIKSFNDLLHAVGTQDTGVYISKDTDFLAVAEVLADALNSLSEKNNENNPLGVAIPVNETDYHWVSFVIDPKEGRKYNATVIRADGKVTKIIGGVRTVDTGFKSAEKGKKGQFYLGIDDDKIEFNASNDIFTGFLSPIKHGWQSLVSAVNKSSVPPTQEFYFRSEMTISNAIIAANKKYVVDKRDATNTYLNRDDSILSREISKFLVAIFEGLEGLLKLQDYDELIFNQGVRHPSSFVINDDGSFTDSSKEGSTSGVQIESEYSYEKNDPYLLGVYRSSWHSITKSFYTLFLAFALMVIIFGLVKLLLNVQTIAVNPYYRGQAYQTIYNYVLVALLMPSVWAVFYILLQFNYYIVDIFGKSVNYQSLQMTALSGATGTISTLILSGFYFVLLVYFNVVYVIRSINIAILMVSAPLVISTLTLGPKYKNIFDIWLKEIVSNIFLQSFHAAILTFLVSVQVHSSGVEKVVLLISLVSLTNVFRSLFLSSQTVSNAEKEGQKAQMTAVAGIGLASVAVGKTIGAGASLVGNYRGTKLDRKAEAFKNESIKNGIYDDKAQDKVKKLQGRAQASRTVGQTMKGLSPAIAGGLSGVAMSAATGGSSLIKGANDVMSGIGGVAGIIDDKLKKGALPGELMLDKKDINENISSINANKDTMSYEYTKGALSKEEHKKMEAIKNNKLLTEDERQEQYAKVLAGNKGIDLQLAKGTDKDGNPTTSVQSRISYDSSTGKLSLENKNTSGYDLTQVGDNVLARKNGNEVGQSNLMSTQERLDWANGSSSTNTSADYSSARPSGEVAATKIDNDRNISNKLSQNGPQLTHQSVTDNVSGSSRTVITNTGQNSNINNSYNPIPEICNSSNIKSHENGTYSYDTRGTQYDNLVNVKQNGSQATFTYKLTDTQQAQIMDKMQQCSSPEEKRDARDNFIRETFGQGATFDKSTGNVKVQAQVSSSISNMQYEDGKIIMSTTDGSAPRAHTPTAHSISSIEEYVHDYNNPMNEKGERVARTDNQIDTDRMYISPDAFGINQNVGNLEGIHINQDNNHVIVPLKDDISADINQFKENYIANYEGDKNSNNYNKNIETAVANYAYANHGVQMINNDKNGGYYIDLGKSSNYNNVLYNNDEILLFNKDSQKSTGENQNQGNPN